MTEAATNAKEELREACAQSFLKELYAFGDDGTRTLMIDPATERLYIKKVLQNYSTPVYRYLKDHPDRHIPGIYSISEEDGRLTVWEDYIPGVTLDAALSLPDPAETRWSLTRAAAEKNRIREIPPCGLPTGDALFIISEVLDALSFLHSADPPIIHRDVKASNIMLADDGRVLLIDYDAAKLRKDNASRDTVLIGTAGSAAPEQYGFAQSDARTDVYGAGVLIKRLLGDLPAYGDVIGRATEMNPKDRYESAKELKAALIGAVPPEQNYRGSAEPAKHRFRLFPPPGFRGTPVWQKFAALCAYLFVFGTILHSDFTAVPARGAELTYKIIAALIFCSWIDVVFDWTHIFTYFPFMRNRHTAVRLAAKAVYCVILWYFWLFILTDVFAVMGWEI